MTQIQAEDYKRFAAALKGADKAVARSIRKRVRDAAGPIGRIVVETGSEGMPARGGLRARLQASRPGVSVTGMAATINLRKGANFVALNAGLLRHRVFGGPRWVAQDVPSGTYTDAFQNLPPGARADLNNVITDAVKELGL